MKMNIAKAERVLDLLRGIDKCRVAVHMLNENYDFALMVGETCEVPFSLDAEREAIACIIKKRYQIMADQLLELGFTLDDDVRGSAMKAFEAGLKSAGGA